MLKKHPFAVEAFFQHSYVLTFAVRPNTIEAMLPPCLQADTFRDEWAFIAVAMVQTEALRPKGFPRILGQDFFLIGYRLFVRYRDQRGKRLRGLYILKSETNKKIMELLGNVFTQYHYSTTDIQQNIEANKIQIQSQQSDFKVSIVSEPSKEVQLPVDSPFADWKTARRFAGPMPFTFSYEPQTQKVLIIEGVRQNWKPKPIEILEYHFGFLDNLQVPEVHLANAFVIEQIPYYWKKGRQEKWTP